MKMKVAYDFEAASLMLARQVEAFDGWLANDHRVLYALYSSPVLPPPELDVPQEVLHHFYTTTVPEWRALASAAIEMQDVIRPLNILEPLWRDVHQGALMQVKKAIAVLADDCGVDVHRLIQASGFLERGEPDPRHKLQRMVFNCVADEEVQPSTPDLVFMLSEVLLKATIGGVDSLLPLIADSATRRERDEVVDERMLRDAATQTIQFMGLGQQLIRWHVACDNLNPKRAEMLRLNPPGG